MEEIRNCQFKFQCQRTWEQLEPTKNKDERYCGACSQTVYLCRTPAALIAAIRKNLCVAVDIRSPSTHKLERLMGDAIY